MRIALLLALLTTACGGTVDTLPDARVPQDERSGLDAPATADQPPADAPAADVASDVSAPDLARDEGRDAPPPDGPPRLAFEEMSLSATHDQVTDFKFLPTSTPGEQELLLIEKPGLITHYRLSGDAALKLGELTAPDVYAGSDCGLVSIAIDPGFATNQFVFLGHCTMKGESRITRLTFDPAQYDAIPASAVPILTVTEPAARYAWHNVGSIGFDPDGNLWALMGEMTVSANAQDLASDRGKLLRLVPSREPGIGGHEPAPNNPFLGDPTRNPLIWAAGLRSPWKGSLDAGGRFFVSDVGDALVEEVNVIDAPGQNLGWPIVEGPCTPDIGDACSGLVDPVAHWSRGQSEPYVMDDPDTTGSNGRAAWVSPSYAPGLAGAPYSYAGRLSGYVFFGDFYSGFIRALKVDAERKVVVDSPAGHLETVSGWDQAADGYLYVLSFGRWQNMFTPGSRLWRVLLQG